MFHIFGYLKQNPKRTLCFSPLRPDLSGGNVNYEAARDFKEIYVDAEEEVPADAPESRGEEVIMIAYVDAFHASNKKTHRSHTGYLIFINMEPIIWYSKRPRTVESSTFGSEYIATRPVWRQFKLCDSSFECLESQSMDPAECSTIISLSSRTQAGLNRH